MTLWPELEPEPEAVTWIRVKASDPIVRGLRDRHYTTTKPGGRTVGPPGRRLVFRTPDGRAGWITHWPDPALVLDKVDAWRCTLFRNEGSALSSALIVEAMRRTAEEWGGRPTAGWLTYVEPGKLASSNPGYCFQVAGWTRDPTWPKHHRLIRLRAPIEPLVNALQGP